MANQACLDALQAFPTKDVGQDQQEINEKIENFKQFYVQQGVSPEKVFLSAVISTKTIVELCEDVDFLTIQLAKDSSDVNELSDFRIMISQCDQRADIIPAPKNFGIELAPSLIFNQIEDFKALYMDATCCRHPPGGQ